MSQKAFHENVKMTHCKFHNALTFFRLIVSQHTPPKTGSVTFELRWLISVKKIIFYNFPISEDAVRVI